MVSCFVSIAPSCDLKNHAVSPVNTRTTTTSHHISIQFKNHLSTSSILLNQVGSESRRLFASYKVRIYNEAEGIDSTFDCPDDKNILDAAMDNGVELPFSCRSGNCSACAGKLTKGQVDQHEQNQLNEKHLKDGFCLTCVAKPKSDCEIISHQEDELGVY